MKTPVLKLFLFVLLLTLSLLPISAQTQTNASQTLDALQHRLAEIVNQPQYAAATWGVKIASLDSGQVLFERNAEKLFSPASNSKLYTMALALTKLGSDYRIKTSLYSQTKPDDQGTLKGDLLIYGRGDPTISGEYNHGDVLKAFEPLIAALTNAGIKQITGDLIGDESFFHGDPFGGGWGWDDLETDYGAEISALTINSNVVQLLVKPGGTVGAPAQLTFYPATTYISVSNRTETTGKGTHRSIRLHRLVGENLVYITGHIPLEDPGSSEDVSVHKPTALFVALFKDALAQHGITVTGATRTMNWLDRESIPLDLSQWTELGSIQSRPFRDIIKSVEKPSQNLYTDMILEHIGALAAETNSTLTSEESGIHELEKFLTKIGILRGDTIFDDGSGLSRNNLTTPNATIALLTYMAHQKDAEIYFNALPIAGVDGTLKRRMKGTPAAGNLRAKTGTLRWANSVSGYMTNAVGEHFVISMMLNRFQPPAGYEKPKTADMDAIANVLAASTFHTEK